MTNGWPIGSEQSSPVLSLPPFPTSGRLSAWFKACDAAVFGRFRWQYERLLEREVIPSCRTLLDVGCGAESPIRSFSHRLEHSVGVDRFEAALDESRRQAIHSSYVCVDILELAGRFAPRSFDCVLASDVIEHLEKADGLRLMHSMEAIARRKVIVFTPNGFQPQGAVGGNPYQVHRSGWTVDEMRGYGYRVIGVNGWKPLRTELAAPRWRPRPLWGRVSYLTQPFTTRRPELAFQMLCIKDL